MKKPTRPAWIGLDRLEPRLLLTSNLVSLAGGWALTDGSAGNDQANDIVVDSAGNTYITGSFSQQMTVDPNNQNTHLTSAGGTDAFVAKYTAAGALSWAVRFGGQQNDAFYGLTVDSSGNVYAIGEFRASITMDYTTITSAGSTDIMLVKLDSNGDLGFFAQYGSYGADSGQSVALDSSGNPYMTGSFYGTVNFGGYTLNSGGTAGIFAGTVDANANARWFLSMGGSSSADSGYSIALDSSDNAYVTGYYGSGSKTFGTFPLTGQGATNCFLAKINTSGVVSWAQGFGTGNAITGLDLAMDVNGHVYLGGYFNQSVTLGLHSLTSAGLSDAYLAKISQSNGSVNWALSMGGPQNDVANALAMDAQANVYVTGYFSNTANFGSHSLTSAGSTDVFITRVEPITANVSWATSMTGIGTNAANAITTAPDGSYAVAGLFNSTINFQPGSTGTSATSTGYADVFFATLTDASKGFATGTVFVDVAASGSMADTDPRVSDWTVYADLNDNNQWDSGEPTTTTNSSGVFTLALDAGSYVLRQQLQTGWTNTTPGSGSYSPTITAGNSSSGLNFGNRVFNKVDDYNGDSYADSAWYDSATTEIRVTTMQGATKIKSHTIGKLGNSNWYLVGAKDCNGDGVMDLVFHNTSTGDISAWLLSDMAITAHQYVNSVADTNWLLRGSADMNQDSSADFVWHNQATDVVSFWLMTGLTVDSTPFVADNVDSPWQIAGAGWVNNDNQPDLLFHNTNTSDVAAWLMNNTTEIGGQVSVSQIGSSWQVTGFGKANTTTSPYGIFWNNQNTSTGLLWRLNNTGAKSDSSDVTF